MTARVAGRWSVALAAAAGAILLLVLFGDRPAATWSHAAFGVAGQGQGAKRAFIALTHMVDPLGPLALIGCIVLGPLAAGRAIRPRYLRVVATACLATLTAIAAKDQLKFAFGRLWPETWTNGNPSWIGSGAYGFSPFHGGAGWFSFPSGHMTLITAPMVVAMIAAPRWRWVATIPIALVAIGLYGADYHFLSDMLAGVLVGAACAVLVWAMTMPTGARDAGG